MSQQQCESCGMPIETGIYCRYCADENGKLPAFEQRFDRMVAWWTGQHPELPSDEVRRQALAYMAQMPAWRDHPKVKAGLPK
jgi:hypothetical protein